MEGSPGSGDGAYLGSDPWAIFGEVVGWSQFFYGDFVCFVAKPYGEFFRFQQSTPENLIRRSLTWHPLQSTSASMMSIKDFG